VIVVKVEMWPGGDESRAYELGSAVIVNDGKGTPDRGNYTAGFHRGAGKATRRTTKFGEVKDFPRKSLNVWHLIARCLKEAGYR
jgi:hypothetical protein